jgi:23S rRNA (pseudouridine1915-N3)-methyltransferase
MKNIKIIAVGKEKSKEINGLIQEYLKRSKWKVEVVELNPAKTLPPTQQKDYEAELIINKLDPKSLIIALDEKGQEMTSIEFAKFLDSAPKNISFIIGGANGLSPEIFKHATKSISFGRFTYPHLIVRMLLIEQIYRAQTILGNHPYNK